MQSLYLRDDLETAVQSGALGTPGSHDDVFAALSRLQGEVYRRSARRCTSRVLIAGKAYFAKTHEGVGWWEIAKNLLAGKRPVLGARNEFEAIRRLRAGGVAVPDVAAFGECGLNPARRRSFALCDALDGFTSLEDVGHGWLGTPPDAKLKRDLLTATGRLTAAIHAAGVCHRDYYACHLLANAAKLARGEAELAVIDLHRARVHRRLSARARVRDLGALLFSTSAMPLTDRDRLCFVAAYAGTPAGVELRRHAGFWRAVRRRAERLRRRAVADALATGERALAGGGIASVGRLADLGRDPALPFRFDLDLRPWRAPSNADPAAVPGADAVRAICTAVLRAQPGRRLVLRATIDGRELILKAFFGPRAERDWAREKRGAKALRGSGVATPELVGAGAGGGARILAFEVLDDAREPSVRDVGKLLATLAQMHCRGIRQRDLHPGNFLVSGNRVYAIDGGSIRVSTPPNSTRRLADVARLLAHYPSAALGPLVPLTAAYEDAAGVVLPKVALGNLCHRVARARRRRVAKFIAKTGRDCTAFAIREDHGCRVVVARGEDDPQLMRILADPDGAAAAGEPLKRGNTASAVRYGDFVVKRYVTKDRWHRLRLRLRGTRAFRSWRAGHGLRLAGLATPRPRALIEVCRPQTGEAVAFLVVDHVDGERLDAVIDGARVDPDLGNAMARTFAAWRELRFAHGDTKASNFVVKDADIHVLDLDAAAFHRGRWRFVGAHRRDRVRFLANWPDPPTAIRAALGRERGVSGERA
ncbi:MAG: lipopolysaccharide core heptose(I) kinase RfaP [Gammaproteobacteria bacterium]|nr:lipopolysaccharide core heptose(I) kinase RfaP [Gammaproteobacteria bacterium]